MSSKNPIFFQSDEIPAPKTEIHCTQCETGIVVWETRDNRFFVCDEAAVLIPSDYKIATCNKCGIRYCNSNMNAKMESDMVSVLAEHKDMIRVAFYRFEKDSIADTDWN